MIEDTTKRKPLKRRIAVTSLLVLAALGAEHLHGRAIPRSGGEQAVARTVEGYDTTSALLGPNSLLGDVCTDQKISSPVCADLGINELDVSSLTDHGGSASMSSPRLEGLDSSSLNMLDHGSGAPSAASLSAVPEPTTAGLLLCAAAPAVALRRPRHRNLAGKLQTRIRDQD